MLWPFRDLQPSDPSFTAVNMLAAQRCLPLSADEVDFHADKPATQAWMNEVVERTRRQLSATKDEHESPTTAKTRGEFARQWWQIIRKGLWKSYARQSATDADGDGIADRDDALPLDAENAALSIAPVSPSGDGLPDNLPEGLVVVKQFNFAGRDVPAVDGFTHDHGEAFDAARGYGWRRDLTQQHRRRGKSKTVADTFIFTRTHDVWECALPNGKYTVNLSIGDAAHEQFGQNVTVEGTPVFRNHTTRVGRFAEKSVEVEVRDGRLTVEIGLPGGETNTCLNWVRVVGRR